MSKGILFPDFNSMHICKESLISKFWAISGKYSFGG